MNAQNTSHDEGPTRGEDLGHIQSGRKDIILHRPCKRKRTTLEIWHAVPQVLGCLFGDTCTP